MPFNAIGFNSLLSLSPFDGKKNKSLASIKEGTSFLSPHITQLLGLLSNKGFQ
jgi:hypothetical protein